MSGSRLHGGKDVVLRRTVFTLHGLLIHDDNLGSPSVPNKLSGEQ